MSTFEKWSLLFAGITAFGVCLGIFGAIRTFYIGRKSKVIVKAQTVSIVKKEDFVYITTNIDLINQTEHPTSVLKICIIFGKIEVPATHVERIVSNLFDTFETKNIILNPFESVSISNQKFKCPTPYFRENAMIIIETTQRKYKYSILCRECEESLE